MPVDPFARLFVIRGLLLFLFFLLDLGKHPLLELALPLEDRGGFNELRVDVLQLVGHSGLVH